MTRRHLPLRLAQVRPEGEYTAMDWEVYPDALRALLVRLDARLRAAQAVYHRKRFGLR